MSASSLAGAAPVTFAGVMGSTTGGSTTEGASMVVLAVPGTLDIVGQRAFPGRPGDEAERAAVAAGPASPNRIEA